MRVMVMIKGTGAAESTPPDDAAIAAMTAYNEQLAEAGILLGGDGLRNSDEGAKVVFEADGTSVVDGPFTEAKEIVGGFWTWEVRSLEEAVEWARRCPRDPHFGDGQVLEIRPFFEAEDFAELLTPELREREDRLTEQVRARNQGD